MEKNITPINQLSWKDRLKSYKKHPGSFILLLLVGASAVITVTVLVYLVGYILIHGVPYLRPSLFSLTYNSDNVSMMPAIINTITMVLLALLFSVPFGIGAAIYLVEYAKKGNKLVELHCCHSRQQTRRYVPRTTLRGVRSRKLQYYLSAFLSQCSRRLHY